jgi:hypothetical protein
MHSVFNLLTAMVSVIVTWSFLIVVFLAIGHLMRRAVGISGSHLFETFWLGWAGTIALLQVWHCFFAVDGRAFAILVLLAALGLYLGAGVRSARALLRDHGSSRYAPVALALATAWVANHAIGPVHNYDSGLYHLQMITWTTTYPLVPGLGNLHGRLAFNNSSFLYMALLDVGYWHTMSRHLGSGLLILMLLAQSVLRVPRVLGASSTHWAADAFLLFLLPAIAWSAVKGAASASPDSTVFVLGAVIAHQLLQLVGERDADPATADFRAVIVSVLAAVKLNFVVFGIAATTMALVMVMSPRRCARRAWWLVGVVATWWGVVLGAWLLRGMVLSGYPLYPMSLAALPVDWRIPEASVHNMQHWITSWARWPGLHWRDAPPGPAWLIPWAVAAIQNRPEVWIPAQLTMTAAGIAVYRRAVDVERWRLFSTPAALVLVPSAAAILVWFAAAPDPRFGSVFLWTFASIALAVTLDGARMRHRLAAAAVTVAVVIITMTGLVSEDPKAFLKRHGANLGLHPTPTATLKEFRTESGLVVLVPSGDDRAWQAPIPSTPYPHANLRLRRAGDLGSGFRVDPFDEAEYVGMHR